MFKDFIKDEMIANLLKGRRIALVGPSNHLVGKGKGFDIDKYDVVCRVNDVYPFNYELDYGIKTDIVFYNCARYSNPEFVVKMNHDPKATKKIKMVILMSVKSLGQDNWESWDENYIAPIVKDWEDMNIYNLPFYWIGLKNYKMMYDDIGCEPNSGFLAILKLLQYDIEELMITGFSFYYQGNQIKDSYYNSYLVEYVYTEDNYPYKNYNAHKSHNQPIQFSYFKDKVLPYYGEKIKIDSFLDRCFKLNHSNVFYI